MTGWIEDGPETVPGRREPVGELAIFDIPPLAFAIIALLLMIPPVFVIIPPPLLTELTPPIDRIDCDGSYIARMDDS